MSFDLSSPADALGAYVKARASLDPDDVVTQWKGSAYGIVPLGGTRRLFGLEGFTIARAVRVDGGYQLMAREAVFYANPATGEVLDTFMNPYTGETNLVVHDWNDPVIDTLTTVSHGSAGADEPSNGSVVRPPELFGDAVHFVSESFVRLANPLLRAKWPRESAADLLETSAFLRLAASHREMDSPGPSASSQTTRTTNGPWLPWMLMGDHPGHLVHQLGGAKLLGGYGELPQHVRSRVEAGRPEFAYAPRTAAGSSENSWTTYGRQRRPAPPH